MLRSGGTGLFAQPPEPGEVAKGVERASALRDRVAHSLVNANMVATLVCPADIPAHKLLAAVQRASPDDVFQEGCAVYILLRERRFRVSDVGGGKVRLTPSCT